MTLKIKDKKLFWGNCFRQFLNNEKFWITWVFLWMKDPDRYSSDPKRQVPVHFFQIRIQFGFGSGSQWLQKTGSGSATLVKTSPNPQLYDKLQTFLCEILISSYDKMFSLKTIYYFCWFCLKDNLNPQILTIVINILISSAFNI